ncbi:MAG: hypothetical protein JW839_19580, partial [Candidatus Lokiarchaeota archaeon]|nr:hypothetical protein [Candidatus Lokiarchaeota archaeon]
MASLAALSTLGVFLWTTKTFDRQEAACEIGASPIFSSGYSPSFTTNWNASQEDWAEGRAWYHNGHIFATGKTSGDTSGALTLIDFNTVSGLVEWASVFDSEYDEEGTAVWGDGTYIYTVGMTGSASSGDDLLLVKWNSTGAVMWNTTYGSTGYDRGSSVWGNASAVYTAGHINVGASNIDALLVSWNPVNGSMLWAKTWGGPSNEFLYAVAGDGTFLYTTGITSSYGAGNFDMCLVKWHGNGT